MISFRYNQETMVVYFVLLLLLLGTTTDSSADAIMSGWMAAQAGAL